MSYIKANKYHLSGILLLILLFATSVYVRKERIEAPLSRHHEWITAHSLITMDIWHQSGGPSNYGFNPIYNYPGKGNKSKRMLGGITDKEGDDYYVSYPPFAFIFAYYFNEMLGGPSVFNMRLLSLAIHLFCVLLIYFIIRQISSNYGKDYFSIAGVFAGFLYIFSTGNLWIHGNLYFADMLEQALFFTCLFLVIRYFKEQYKQEQITLIWIGIFFFFATYTEWLGLFFAFFSGTAFLIGYFISKKRSYLRPFIVIALSSGLALSLTIFQFSSIVDFDAFVDASKTKYDQRSGHLTEEETNNVFNMHSEHSYLAIERYLTQGYKMVENFIGISLILLTAALVYRRSRKNMQKIRWKLIAFFLVFLSILTHYILFFNFNSIHDFSSLKTGGLMILFVGLVMLIVLESLQKKIKIILGILLIPLCIQKGLTSINKYYELFPMEEVDYDRLTSAEKMRQLSHPDIPIYMNTRLSPEPVYYAKHNMFPISDTSLLLNFMNLFDEDEAQYYHHKGSKLEYMLKIKKENGKIKVEDKLVFYIKTGNDNIHHHQK